MSRYQTSQYLAYNSCKVYKQHLNQSISTAETVELAAKMLEQTDKLN